LNSLARPQKKMYKHFYVVFKKMRQDTYIAPRSLVLDGDEWSVSCSGIFNLSSHWMCLTVSLDAVANRNIPVSTWNRTPIASHFTDWAVWVGSHCTYTSIGCKRISAPMGKAKPQTCLLRTGVRFFTLVNENTEFYRLRSFLIFKIRLSGCIIKIPPLLGRNKPQLAALDNRKYSPTVP
jgi:hypothetical protein